MCFRAFRLITQTLVPMMVWLGLTGCATSNSLSDQVNPADRQVEEMRLRTDGTKVVDVHGKPIGLFGVNIASLEWRDDGDHVEESVHRAIADWKVNVIRLPLAQDRWFGKMPSQVDGGSAYRELVDKVVDICATQRVYIVLDLHWSNCGKWVNEGGRLGQHVMPDVQSAEFWRDAATRYKNRPHVIFCLYNEPHDVSWEAWRNGGTVTDVPSRQERDQTRVTYEAVGMQKLYDIVRATGAKNLITVSGLDWGYDLSGVLRGYAIEGRDIVYETHPYPQKREWDRGFGEVSRRFPVFIGEWGSVGNTEGLDYGRRLMEYAEQHDVQFWTAWDFHPQAGPTLIRNWSYEPTAFGSYVKDLLATKAAARSSGRTE